MPKALHSASIEADCSRCVALCCVLLSFDRSDAFAFDKASGEPCHHLTRQWRCAVHADLEGEGMGGCAAYDCAGAGPRVVEEVFGLDRLSWAWLHDERQVALLADVFGVLQRVHALLSLVQAAVALGLSTRHLAEAEGLATRLRPAARWSPEEVLALDVTSLSADVHGFLRGLAVSLPGADRQRRRLPVLGARTPSAGIEGDSMRGAPRRGVQSKSKSRSLGEG